MGSHGGADFFDSLLTASTMIKSPRALFACHERARLRRPDASPAPSQRLSSAHLRTRTPVAPKRAAVRSRRAQTGWPGSICSRPRSRCRRCRLRRRRRCRACPARCSLSPASVTPRPCSRGARGAPPGMCAQHAGRAHDETSRRAQHAAGRALQVLRARQGPAELQGLNEAAWPTLIWSQRCGLWTAAHDP